MRIYVDTANLDEIREWRTHPWVSGFTTNPTLMRNTEHVVNTQRLGPHGRTAGEWAAEAVEAADGYPISIDGPPEVRELGLNVYRKVLPPRTGVTDPGPRTNITAICHTNQLRGVRFSATDAIISVFAGRIMDTGRDPQPVIDAAKATGAQVLWASVREPYNIVQAEQAGCDIITVPPAILRKWLDWNGKPLETVAAETIAQFAKDSEGLWTS
jgi:transaldolase